jgi:hypothetical protein
MDWLNKRLQDAVQMDNHLTISAKTGSAIHCEINGLILTQQPCCVNKFVVLPVLLC